MSSSGPKFQRVVAIDGPAASGKSSVARELSRRLGFVYVNSGAIYRAITWHVLEQGVDPKDATGVVRLLNRTKVTSELTAHASRILINDLDPVDHLREARVNDQVSP